jgi:hypothetical protein
MGVVQHKQKKFDIPSKAPFAEKLIKEYKEGMDERKKQKNRDIRDNGLKFQDPTLPDNSEIIEDN